MTLVQHEQARYYLHLGREQLTPDERTALDEHLHACADCRAYAAELADLQANLKHALHQRWDAAEPTIDLEQRINTRLNSKRWPQRALSYALGLAGLIIFVFVVHALFVSQTQGTAVDSPVATVDLTPILRPTQQVFVPPTPTPPSGRDFYRLQRLTTTPNGAFRPAVSPDGTRVAYASERDGNWDIYVLDLTTDAETRLTDDPLNDMAPSWSPDGMRIAYQHNLPASTGPVLVDRIVMKADGSDKTVVASGSNWLGNEAPAWSPDGTRLAFTDSGGIVIVNVDDRREVDRFTPSNGQPYFEPVWVDDDHIVFTVDNTAVLGNITNNTIEMSYSGAGFVPRVMARGPDIAFVWQDGTSVQVKRVRFDGSNPGDMGTFQDQTIVYADWSPDKRFVAVETSTGLYVMSDQVIFPDWSGQRGALFKINDDVPSSDLLSISWLPDSSGFVFVANPGGQPDLYLAKLNQPLIDYLRQHVAMPGPTTTSSTSTPIATSALSVTSVSFAPEPSAPLERSSGFNFGGEIAGTTPGDVLAHFTAFALRPNENVPECMTQSVPTDRPFWADQTTITAGQFTFGRLYPFSDTLPDADRLVARISLIEPGVNGRLLYCSQQVYSLTSTSTPTVPPLTPPSSSATPDVALTPTPGWYSYVSDSFAVQLQYPSSWQRLPGLPYKFGGADGFFQLGAENGSSNPLAACQTEAGLPARPYGSSPSIESLVVAGQEACLIMPSADQPIELQQQAMLIVRYPQPIGSITPGLAYTYFVLRADAPHLRSIAASLVFLPPGTPTPAPTPTLYETSTSTPQ